jgi:hypothetical protein
VDSATDPLLEGAHGALNLTNVTVRWNDVQCNGPDVVTNALELIVGMDVANAKTTTTVQPEEASQLVKDDAFATAGDLGKGAECNRSRDGVQETDALDEKEIDTKGKVGVMLKNVGRNGLRHESWDMRSGGTAGGLSLEGHQVRAVNESSTLGIIHGHGAISDEVVSQDVEENRLGGAPDLPIKSTGGVGVAKFSRGEHLPVVSDGGEESGVANGEGDRRCLGYRASGVKHVESAGMLDKSHEGTIESVYVHSRSIAGVQGHAAHTSDFGKGQDVCN